MNEKLRNIMYFIFICDVVLLFILIMVINFKYCSNLFCDPI